MKPQQPLLIAVSFLIAGLLCFACNSNEKTKAPDISGIKVSIPLERFDQDFFSIDTLNIASSTARLQAKYPIMFPIFVQNILGLDSVSFVPGIKAFIRLTKSIADTTSIVFRSTNEMKDDFEKAFRYVKYYFPDYKIPKLVTVVGPIDALAQTASGFSPDFLGPDFLGISLQFYLGRDYPVYQDPYFTDQVAPLYRSRRFSKEYILPDAMQLVTDDLFPDKSSTRPLIEQMVEKGKQWWLLDKFLPYTADSLKTGFTQQQLDWCLQNEGLIWSQIIKNEDLYSINNATIQTYIGEGPFTQGFPQEASPGNLGQWIGWRIVSKYADQHPEKKPGEIMQTPFKELFEQAKYKPK